jgi:hypothetical protein
MARPTRAKTSTRWRSIWPKPTNNFERGGHDVRTGNFGAFCFDAYYIFGGITPQLWKFHEVLEKLTGKLLKRRGGFDISLRQMLLSACADLRNSLRAHNKYS